MNDEYIKHDNPNREHGKKALKRGLILMCAITGAAVFAMLILIVFLNKYLPELNLVLWPRTDAGNTSAVANYTDGVDYASESVNTAGDGVYYFGALELPVNGATGYASVKVDMFEELGGGSVIKELPPGAGFLILYEDGDWWRVKDGENAEGWVRHDLCMINLPDVIPSIIYNNTNADASVFLSSGREIPNITGKQLYDSKTYNARLGREEYNVAVMYSMSKRIFDAQKAALAGGDCLIIYEGFRPYDVQKDIAKELKALAAANEEVREGMKPSVWGINWFIAGGLSSHQRGSAIDVSLADVRETVEKTAGDFAYVRVESYFLHSMPSPIHELSAVSVVFAYPVSSSLTGWVGVPLSEGMKESAAAQKLQKYCTDAGLTPLASEWWHFDDLYSNKRVANSNGNYYLTENYSLPPQGE